MKYVSFGILSAVIGLLFTVQSAFALTVSPVKLEIAGDPGQELTGDVKLLNEEDHAVTYYTSFERFEAQGESGDPVFTQATEGLPTWIKIQESVTLQPQERLTVPYVIDIPKNATPGGNFAAIFFNTVPPKDLNAGQVAVGAKVGVLVLLRVSGDIAENGALLQYGIENNQKLFTTPPVNFWYRFSNSGADRVKPSGTVTIKNTFGLTAAKFNANPTDGNVLPDSIRRLTTSWKLQDHWGKDVPGPDNQSFGTLAWYEMRHFHLGYFTAKLHVEYGTKGEIAEGRVHFFMIPWHALVIIVPVLLVLLILGIIFMKRYNRWIIRKANAGQSTTS